MANYYGNARTNYFAVKDREAFEIALMFIPDVEIIEDGDDDNVGIMVSGGDYGGWPGFIDRDQVIDDCEGNDSIVPAWILESKDSDVEIDLPAIVSEHLQDGEVAIFMENGAEKLRYLVGVAHAINNKGETRTINLTDIYELAHELTDSTKGIKLAEF